VDSASNLSPSAPTVNFEVRPQCYDDGDLLAARDLQAKANRVTETLISFGFMGALYATLGMLGAECGGPRLPAQPLAAQRKESLRAALKAVDFFEIAAM